MQRQLSDRFVLDDDRNRIDRGAIHAFLAGSYWAAGRGRSVMDALVESAARVVGLYAPDGSQG